MGSRVWPSIPERFTAGDGREMRLVTAQDAAAIEAALPEGQRAETFHFFTVRPFPLAEFIADPAKRTYALWSGDRPLACTTVYNTDEDAGSV
ncbi:MAG: hypothetical protein L0K56_12865, partial [Corynebacterium sp.]|nr:hypothetical protein [Corynebacterium sp.]